MSNNNWFIKLTFLIFFFSTYSISFAQEKQKNLMESYIGEWHGKATIQNINMFGGWSPGRFLGIHATIRDIWQVKLNVKFVHPLDDPLLVEEYKKAGIPLDYLNNLKNMMPTSLLTSLRIIGNAVISGFSEYTHETREYCEECKGKDGTQKKDFPEIFIPVSGDVNLENNEIDINFRFGDLPKGYDGGLSCFLSANKKLVEPNKIVFSYKHFEEYEVDQNVTGELYRIDRLKKSFPKDIKPNESIETDKKTRIEITIPNIGRVNIAENTKAKFKSENLLEVVKGKIHGFIKKLKPKTKFEIHTPTCALSVRGTEYALNVEDDGTTTLIVLDGEVEFSDKEKKITVLVKKNQQSVVKPGELPSEPVQINPDQILKWWE